MAGQKHIIKKFSIELQTPGGQQGYALQHRCIKLVKESLVNEIDEFLSDHFRDDTITRIGKMEIDLGDITTENLEKEFVKKCMAGFGNTIKAFNVNQKKSGEGEIINIGKEENVLEQFLYFLSSGKMQWTAYGMDFYKWERAVTDAIKKKAGSFKQAFSDLLMLRPSALERLVTQFDGEFFKVIVDIYQPALRSEYENLARLLKEEKFCADNGAIRNKILLSLLPGIFGNAKKGDIDDVLELIELLRIQFQNSEFEKLILLLKETMITIAEKSVNTFNTSPLIPGLDEKVASDMANIKIINDAADDKATYIANAGLIILHPFLQNLFHATGLMQSGKFIDDFGKQKAAHLLQYLANGQQQLPEYLMPLNKILCGIGEEGHINRFIKLEEAEIKEANELLQAVIKHWPALKDTSVEALRETFLQRNGKLSFNGRDGYWKLQVERKTVDVLLDKIPWGYSYIQLPWMKYALVTDW